MKLPDDEARVVLSPGFPSREDFSRARDAHQELRGKPSGVDPFRFLLLPFAFQWRRELLHRLETLGQPVRLTNLVTLQDRFLGFLWRRAGQPVRHSYPEDDIDDAFLARFGVRKEGEAHQVVARELAEELTSFREGMPRWWLMLAEMTTRSSLFIVHVLQESARLSSRLGWTGAEAPAIALDPWKSDPHDGNRTAVRVAFESGGLWYFKPRVLDMEALMTGLIRRAQGLFPELFPTVLPKLHPSGTEGWMEAIRPCRNLPEHYHADYFRRAGALLALVRSLGGIDFYRDNLVSDAEGWLVPVDSECLFADETLDGRGPVGILDSGILPIPSRRLGARVAGVAAGFLDVPEARLREILGRGASFMAEGFRRCRIPLARDLLAWSGEKGLRDRCSGLKRRRLRIGTMGYYAAIERSLSPSDLRDDASWKRALRGHLEEFSPRASADARGTERDIEDLSRLDIPHWTEDLGAPGGRVFERLEARLGRVDEAWVTEETRLLVQSLSSGDTKEA